MRARGRGAAVAGWVLIAATWGCAQATPYVPMDGGAYGWSERQLDPDTFLIRFHGNAKNESHDVERNVLKRAAQLTLEHGFSHFMVTDAHPEPRTVGGISAPLAIPNRMPGRAIRVKCFDGSPSWVEAIDAEQYLRAEW